MAVFEVMCPTVKLTDRLQFLENLNSILTVLGRGEGFV